MQAPHFLYSIYERRLLKDLDRSRLPRHIGIVLDGHRRHAREEGLNSYQESYRAGMHRFEEFLGWVEELGIPVVTAWLLSRENLSRPEGELEQPNRDATREGIVTTAQNLESIGAGISWDYSNLVLPASKDLHSRVDVVEV